MLRALTLTLEGPWQSYGASSVGGDRPTEDAPTRSAVLGVLGAALGIDREDVRSLVALDRELSLLVRVDRAGSVQEDFHTAEGVPSHRGHGASKYPVITRRRYLADARFTVLLTDAARPARSLEALHHALRYPRYAPVLGRRACAPSVPLVRREGALVEGEDWRALLCAVPVEALARGRGESGSEEYEVRLDDALCTDEDRRAGRRLLRRERLVGPGKRMFFDHLAWSLRWRAGEAPRAAEGATGEDTTGGYL